jgi:hypothetical protein
VIFLKKGCPPENSYFVFAFFISSVFKCFLVFIQKVIKKTHTQVATAIAQQIHTYPENAQFKETQPDHKKHLHKQTFVMLWARFGLVVRVAGRHTRDPGSNPDRDGPYTFGCIPKRFEYAAA